MQFYSEFLDPIRTGEKERTAGCTILKLQAIADDPVKLGTTNAFASPMILSRECAGNRSFLDLVANRRIQFLKWPKGKGPREALEDALKGNYLFAPWPDCIQDRSVREDALERLGNGTTETGNQELDEMISYARDLFAAIEDADIAETELERGPNFAARMKEIASVSGWCGEVPGVDRLFECIQEIDVSEGHMRGNVWRMIDCQDESEEAIASAKEVVSIHYNEWFTWALKLPLLLVAPRKIRYEQIRQERIDPCDVHLQELNTSEIPPPDFLTWEVIASANRQVRRSGDTDWSKPIRNEKMREEFMKRLTNSFAIRMLNEEKPTLALRGTGPRDAVVLLSHSLVKWASNNLTGIRSLPVFEQLR